MTWTLWTDQRPTDLRAGTVYLWRTKHRRTGHVLIYAGAIRKMHDGWKNEDFFLPPCAHWDGYKHNIPADLCWSDEVPDWYFDHRASRPWEETRLITVEGLTPLPCPFTGYAPRWESFGGWVGSCPENHETFRLSSYIARVERSNPADAVNMWNRRSV